MNIQDLITFFEQLKNEYGSDAKVYFMEYIDHYMTLDMSLNSVDVEQQNKSVYTGSEWVELAETENVITVSMSREDR